MYLVTGIWRKIFMCMNICVSTYVCNCVLVVNTYNKNMYTTTALMLHQNNMSRSQVQQTLEIETYGRTLLTTSVDPQMHYSEQTCAIPSSILLPPQLLQKIPDRQRLGRVCQNHIASHRLVNPPHAFKTQSTKTKNPKAPTP